MSSRSINIALVLILAVVICGSRPNPESPYNEKRERLWGENGGIVTHTIVTPLYPSDGAVDIAIADTLKWSITPSPDSVIVYFGTTGARVGKSASNSYYPFSGLSYNASYSWKIVAYRNGDSTTSSVFDFTTLWIPEADPSLLWHVMADTAYSDAGVTLITDDDTPVQRLRDLSGNGVNWNQTSANNKPLWDTGVQNGRPGILIGSDDFMGSTYKVTNGQSIIHVWKIKTAPASTKGNWDSYPSNRLEIYVGSTAQHLVNYYFAGKNHNTTSTTTGTGVVSILSFNGDTTDIWSNGTKYTYGDSLVTATGGTYIGRDSGNAYLNAWLLETFALDGVVDDSKATTIRNYIYRRWGL